MAVIDGNGWKRRDALVQTLEATRGLTFSLENVKLILDVPEVAALKGGQRVSSGSCCRPPAPPRRASRVASQPLDG